MDISASNCIGSVSAPRVGGEPSRESAGNPVPEIRISPEDEHIPRDTPIRAVSSDVQHMLIPQAERPLVRSKSLIEISDSPNGGQATSPKLVQVPQRTKRFSFLSIDNEKRNSEKAGAKIDQNASVHSLPRQPTFQYLIPKITHRKLNGPNSLANGCQIDIVVVHMCGNSKKHDDWEFPAFVESKERSNDSEARKRPQSRRSGFYVEGSCSQTYGTEQRPATMSWLENPEMLPQIIPTARVMAFGLDINERVSSTANAPIDVQHAATEILNIFLQQWIKEGQPIVFVGHGYGTTVVDHMLFGELLGTVEKASRQRVVESTAAVAMFAPPLENFDSLINWMANEYNIPRDSIFFEARKTSDGRAPRVVGHDFFKNTANRNIATIGYLEREKESKPAKSPEVHPQNSLKRFDWVYSCDADVDNIARIDDAKDSRFVSFTEAISNAVGTHQLLRAARASNKRAMDELLASSVDFKFEMGRRQTVLHLAVEQRLGDLVQSLVHSGKVDLDRQDEAGNTALHIATISSSPEIVLHLLKAGANTGILNKDGKSSEGMALEERANPFIRDLFKRRPLVEAPIGPRTLIREDPANINTQEACRRAGMVAREVFKPTDSKPERHLPVYKSVHDFIYTEDDIEDFFQAASDEKPGSAMCRWYHIPMNNMAWVHDLFAKLKLRYWPWPKPYKRSKFPHGRYMNPEATWLCELQSFSRTPSDDSWVIFMPYISYESSVRQQQISNIIERVGLVRPNKFLLPNLPFSGRRLLNQRRSASHAGSMVVPHEDPEALAIRGYLNDHSHSQNKHLAFHVRRTLDQSYYNMLKDTSYRDRTQVVSRGAKHQLPDGSDHNILMVDQLWLWFVKGKDGKPDTIISSFPSREGAQPQSTREVDDLQGTVLDPTDRKSICESTDLVSRILSACCHAFDRHQHLESINFLYYFESAIGRAEEEEIRLFRRFRRRANKLHSLHEKHRTYSEHRSMLLRKLLDILRESKLLKEIKDILDEIKMVKSVLKDQYKAVESLQEMVNQSSKSAHNAQLGKEFSNALMLIRETDESFDCMDAHAKQVEKGLEHLLDLKQKQANLWEARSSREGAEETAKQGKTIMVFTVVTIIFLPLSFMASFFSLGVSIFPKKDGENNLPLGWVAMFLFGISFAVSIPFVILAFNISKFSEAWSRATHSANKHTAFLLLKPLRESGRRRQRRWIPSERVRAKCQKWYREWVEFVVKHDLPLRPDGEMEARLDREIDGENQSQNHHHHHHHQQVDDEDLFHADSSSDGEVTDEEELGLAVRQMERQRNLLQWMKR